MAGGALGLVAKVGGDASPVPEIQLAPVRSVQLSPRRVVAGTVTTAVANAAVRFPDVRLTRVRIRPQVLGAGREAWIGPQGVTVGGNGYPLRTIDDFIDLELSDLGQLYLITAGVGDSIRYIGA